MKTTLTSILASIAIALTAAAATPSLRIEMTVATSGDRLVSKPSIYVESGERAMIASGDKESELRFDLRPTLLDHRTVDIQMVITQRNGKKTDRYAPRILVPLGKLAKVKFGELVVTVEPFVAKWPRRLTMRCSELLRASQPVLPPPRCARPQPPFRTGCAALRSR